MVCVDCEDVVERRRVGRRIDGNWRLVLLDLLARILHGKKKAVRRDGRTNWASLLSHINLHWFPSFVSGGNGNVRREGSLSLAAAGAPVTRALSPGPLVVSNSPSNYQTPLLSGIRLCMDHQVLYALLIKYRFKIPNLNLSSAKRLHLTKKRRQTQSLNQSRCRGCPTVRHAYVRTDAKFAFEASIGRRIFAVDD